MTVVEAQEFLQRHAVKFILAQFVDIHGSAKTKCVPVAHFDGLLTTGVGFAGFAIWGLGIGPEGPEYTAIGDLSTLTLVPWMPGYARIACDGHVLGKPYEYCPRVALKAQLARFEAKGWTMYTGIEPEFMLLERRQDGTLVRRCRDVPVPAPRPRRRVGGGRWLRAARSRPAARSSAHRSRSR